MFKPLKLVLCMTAGTLASSLILSGCQLTPNTVSGTEATAPAAAAPAPATPAPVTPIYRGGEGSDGGGGGPGGGGGGGWG